MAMTEELDVRAIPKPRRHPLIFTRFTALQPGECFVLVNNHDPKHLREEFERDRPGTFAWTYLDKGPESWRIEITKLTATPSPQVVCDVLTVVDKAGEQSGAIWNLSLAQRHLDANVIHLPAGERIASHLGPDLDVLMLVVDGAGAINSDTGDLSLDAGALVWLPRRSRREIVAGRSGLSYLTVHPRRPALSIEPASG